MILSVILSYYEADYQLYA